MPTRVGGVNGSIATGLIHYADFAAFDLEVGQIVEEDTAYSDTAESHIGNSVPGYRATARGFARKGSTTSAPGLGALAATGATTTFTFDTGCSVALVTIVERVSTSHSKKSAAIALNYSLIGDGAATETWATV